MTPAELRVVREFLGLTGEALAHLLGVQDRTVRRWEAGTVPIPDGVRIQVEQLEAVAGETVSQHIDTLMDLPDPTVLTFRSDAEYHQHHPGEADYPASWHRAIVARIAQDVPALSIVYPPETR